MAHENINHGQNEGADTPRAELASPGNPKKSNRGFASMDRSKQREIASKGGRAAHEKGTAHQFTPDEARQAGRKGGGAVSQDRQHMAEIGRIGGQARGRKQRAKAETESQSEIESSPDSEATGERTSHH